MPSFPRAVGLTEQAMKAAQLRHKAISNNIANVNVPDYQGVMVSFEEELQRALAVKEEGGLQGLVTDSRHIPIPPRQPVSTPVEPRIVLMQDEMRQDGNNVDIDEQMAKLAATQLWYQALTRTISDEFSRLRIAITEGRR